MNAAIRRPLMLFECLPEKPEKLCTLSGPCRSLVDSADAQLPFVCESIMDTVNLHVKSTENLGDRNCAPCLYFGLGTNFERDVRQLPQSGNVLIFGGGGLFHPAFLGAMQRAVETNPAKIAVWGAGANQHGKTQPEYPEWLGRCDLVGVRDFGTSHRWVPCASCMHPELSKPIKPSHKVVVYRHATVPGNIPVIEGAPLLTNYVGSMEEAVRFLGSDEFVLTNTYHGMYWATLLGRKVIVYPFSTRHLFAKHRPTIAAPDDKLGDLMLQAVSYPDALLECREVNETFYRDYQALFARTASSHPGQIRLDRSRHRSRLLEVVSKL